MGKRKRPADNESVPNEQSSTRTRIVPVQDKAGILYIQNDTNTSQSNKQKTTTYYQIQESNGGSVIQETRSNNTETEDNVTFKCIKCEQIFPSKQVFLEHCKFHYFACDLCTNCIFDDLYQLNIHMIKHINKYNICEKCNVMCNSTDELKSHLGGHITTYNKNEVVITNSEQSNALSDDSLIEHLASELDQSIGNTVKIKPQKYRCGVCKQDFNDPRALFKHMNQVHINLPLQTQVIQQQQTNQQLVNPSPSLNQITQQQQQSQNVQLSNQTVQENVVYTNIDSNSIYYDERTGQYYTIALMDNSSPLSEAGGSGQSVIEYVHDSANINHGQNMEYLEDGQNQETIIIEDESQHSQISHQQHLVQTPVQQTKVTQHVPQTQIVNTKHHHHHQQTPQQNHHQQQQSHLMTQNNSNSSAITKMSVASNEPPPLVQITRDTDLEELIPTTTLVADAPVQKISKQDTSSSSSSKIGAVTKCENCHTTFAKKLPKQMFCNNCVSKLASSGSKH